MGHDVTTLIQAARETVAHVKLTLPLGAGNKPLETIPQTGVLQFLQATGHAFQARQEVKQAQRERFISDENQTVRVELAADAAARNKAGNCGEMAAVAFVFLKKRGIGPIDLVQQRSRNHGFLLLGRAVQHGAEDIPEWINGAVICDPWENKHGLLTDFGQQYDIRDMIPVMRYEPGKMAEWKNL